MREGVSPMGLWLSFLAFKILHFGLMLALPLIALDYPPVIIVATYFLAGSLTSLVFIVMLVGTHFFNEATFPVPSADACLHNSWARHNLETSCDWNPTSPFARFISGGANCHAAHHLFPNICHTHYGKLAAMISEESERFSVTYHSMSISEMMISHFRLLKRLGIPD